MDMSLTMQYRQVHYERGLVYSGAGQYEQAIKNFSKAIDLDPECTIAFYDRGMAYKEIKEYKNAISDFEQFLVLIPKAKNKDKIQAIIDELKEKLKNPKPAKRWIGLTKADVARQAREAATHRDRDK
ncbi:tetratricopeptide repeat protein [Anaerolineales bacterium HSG6]|nr:tetratricopeptide repeat protein [Anaerolineales bacterium HSG6]MDM8530125.1 tetratricopeptide repeat protein [Anaerolineales bacterium HSG25]